MSYPYDSGRSSPDPLSDLMDDITPTMASETSIAKEKSRKSAESNISSLDHDKTSAQSQPTKGKLVFSDLKSSQWSKENLARLKKPEVRLDANIKPFSEFNKNSITTKDFSAKKPETLPLTSTGKKRTVMASPTVDYSYPKSIRLTDPTKLTDIKTKSQLAILKSRDLLLEAYGLTEDREEQTNILDLVEVFRYYTEFGRIKRINQSTPPRTIETSLPTKGQNPPKPPQPSCHNNAQIQDCCDSSIETFPTLPAATKPSMETSPKSLWTTVTGRKNSAPTTGDYCEKTLSPEPTRSEKILTILVSKNAQVPKYNAAAIRNTINKALGKLAISRVHTSPNNNIVFTCHQSTPDELLEKKESWISITENWSVDDIRKVNDHSKIVVHGVPTSMSIEEFKDEVFFFNQDVHIEGEPRWLTATNNKRHSSIVATVRDETEKSRIKNFGLLIGGTLLKVVNYQSKTSKTQCQKCLNYGHQTIHCKKSARCAHCAGTHLTTDHTCTNCQASQPCEHMAKKCALCNSETHSAFEREYCEVYKALL